MVIAMTKLAERLSLNTGLVAGSSPFMRIEGKVGTKMRARASGIPARNSSSRIRQHGRFGVCAAFLSTVLMVGGGFGGSAAAQEGRTQFKVPRFVSLKSNRVNLRKGPGTDYPTSWVFRRAGLPVEIVKEFEGWRQVRDAEGTTGWVLGSLLSGRRTAQILPWDVKSSQERPQVALTSRESERSIPVVMVEAGVVADIHECDGEWCFVSVDKYRGYVAQKKLWGVYPDEIIK